MRKEVYESPFTEKMEVEVEGNFCASATIQAESTIEVESYSELSPEDKIGIENEITFY